LPEVICNTSPLQYLHQVGLLHILPSLARPVIIPASVVDELAAGRALGLDLPDPAGLEWITVQTPHSAPVLPMVTDLGPGETQVIALAIERQGAVAVLDDAIARQVAQNLGIRFTGTLGLLLDAKRTGAIRAITPVLDQLQSLRFRVSPRTREAVRRMAGESQES